MNLSKQSSTHLPMLIKFVQATKGPVVEFGSGAFSTPVLHWLCAEDKRPLYTFEHNSKYIDFARKFQSRNHRVELVKDWDKVEVPKYSVVLIDHEPIWRRGKDAARCMFNADFVICHDTENPEQYGYNEIFNKFKYRLDHKNGIYQTTILSNFIDPCTI